MLDRSPNSGSPQESDVVRALREQLARSEEAERRWLTIIEHPFEFVGIVDRNFVLQYINRIQFGYKSEDVLGKLTIFDFLASDCHDEVRRKIQSVFETGEAETYEVYAPEPVDRWYHTLVTPFEKTVGIDSVALQSHDITAQKDAERDLLESERRFQQMAENIEDCFYLLDLNEAHVDYVSPSAVNVLGILPEKLQSDPRAWLSAVHPDDLADCQTRFGKLMSREYDYGIPHEYRVVRNGETFWVQNRAFAIRDGQEQVLHVAGIVTDITERKRVSADLLEAEARYRKLIETLPIISYVSTPRALVTDPSDRRSVQYISPQIEWKLGYTQEEWTADPDFWKSRIHPADRDVVMRTKADHVQSGGSMSLEYRILAKDDVPLAVREEATMVQLDGEEYPRVHGVLLDVSEAMEARAGEQRAQEASHQLVQVQENERRHLARELHDEVGQDLTLLRMLLDSMETNDSAVRVEKLKQARNTVQDLMSKIHDMALDLRPGILDDLGLLPALIWLVQRVSDQTHLKIRFDHQGLEERLTTDIETCAYRIVQEALTNCARHAGAENVHLRVWGIGSMLNIQIEDKGAGFDADAALDSPATAGLIGMRERATAVGGSFELESAPGEGCRLSIQVPKEKQDAL